MEISKFRSRLPAALAQMTGHLHGPESTLRKLGKTLAGKLSRLLGALRARKNELRDSLRSSLSRSAIAANRTVAGFRSQVLMTLKYMALGLRRAWNALARLGKRLVDKPRMRREALRASEKELNQLLASSLDAIAVINGDHRFVAANPKALDLFGISEANIANFSIDVFLSRGQVRDLGASSSPFTGRHERRGKCKILRLDGSLRVAEYVVVTNFLPLMHLYRFSDVTQQRRRVRLLAKIQAVHTDSQIPVN